MISQLERKLAARISPSDVVQETFLEALPFEQVGQRLGRSTGAARMLWLRAIELLRERMNVRGQDD